MAAPGSEKSGKKKTEKKLAAREEAKLLASFMGVMNAMRKQVGPGSAAPPGHLRRDRGPAAAGGPVSPAGASAGPFANGSPGAAKRWGWGALSGSLSARDGLSAPVSRAVRPRSGAAAGGGTVVWFHWSSSFLCFVPNASGHRMKKPMAVQGAGGLIFTNLDFWC